MRLTVPKLPEAPGKRKGRTGNGPPLRVLITGDSAAAGVGADSQAQALSGKLTAHLAPVFTVSWKLVAKNGKTTSDLIEWLSQSPRESFDVVILSLGVNDITSGVSLETWLKHQEHLVNLLRRKFGATQILLSAVPPMDKFPALPRPLCWVIGNQTNRFNRALETWVNTQPDCNFLKLPDSLDVTQIAPDGFHPGPKVYELWGKLAAQAIIRHRRIHTASPR
ncbi:MAG: SGNH/GDSL hydrolase family protein [Thermodesulfobacteriota bacterium]|nr:SGNH/GDSL hydrolase family protein [Thermodesulfobacteriota bacterium]